MWLSVVENALKDPDSWIHAMWLWANTLVFEKSDGEAHSSKLTLDRNLLNIMLVINKVKQIKCEHILYFGLIITVLMHSATQLWFHVVVLVFSLKK